MRHSETVTFGGGNLERRAEWRGDDARLSKALADGAPVLMVWRGKPLAGPQGLAWVTRDHPLVQDTPFLLLGEDQGQLHFAADVSGWTPDDLDDTTLGLFLDPSIQRPPGVDDETGFTELRSIMTRLDVRQAEMAAIAKAVLGWHVSHRFCARCGEQSDWHMAGWQRNCSACGGKHFPRTDPVVIMLIVHGNSVLVGRSPGWPEGMYSLLAGFVEPGETLEAAVRREVYEETRVTVGEVGYLASQPWPFPSSLMFGAIGHATSRAITIDPVEIEDAIWVSREEMAQVFAGEHPIIKPARLGAIAHFLLRNWLADTLD